MEASYFWASFLAVARYHLVVLAILFSSRCPPTVHTPLHMAGQHGQQAEHHDLKPITGPINRDQCISYSRDQLMAIQHSHPIRLNNDLVNKLRSLEIGTGLPRKRYSRKTGKTGKTNHLKWMSLNVQSSRQVATDISEMVLNNNLDILMLTETWLYAEGDEAYQSAMTPLVISLTFSHAMGREEVESLSFLDLTYLNMSSLLH